LSTRFEGITGGLARVCALALPPFVLLEVNYPLLRPQSELAIFAGLGLALGFLRSTGRDGGPARIGPAVRLATALAAMAVCLYVVVQTEPAFAGVWIGGSSLGDRAGAEAGVDVAIGVVGLILVIAATYRSIGPALPILALAFLAYARWGSLLPDWLLPIRGYSVERIVGQTFLHGQGVFGVALSVMFGYVFLFLLFGALLEASGATRFVLDASRRLFRHTTGGPAKVAVVSSGLMGSLSGSAVANTATTGTFTIPMMRSAGFRPAVAGGLEAAASSGGALVPPVMGAGAYMMLEIVDPPVTYLEIIRAALIPAILYYLAVFLIVDLGARRLRAGGSDEGTDDPAPRLVPWQGVVFCGGLAALVGFLLAGTSVFRAVSLGMLTVLILSLARSETRVTFSRLLDALRQASAGGVALISAAACVGVIIGVVTLTGVGGRLPALILPLAQESLVGALAVLMVSSLVLGMGLPSAVCYLLLATLVGPALGRLGVVPLAAHLFIFYFGLMSMVTPPVALAAYAASSIAGSDFWRTSVAAFRFALVGFALPYMFVFRPELLMLATDGGVAAPAAVAGATILAVAGIVPLAAAIAGYLWRPLTPAWRVAMLVSAALLLLPSGGETRFTAWQLAGALIPAAAALAGWRAGRSPG
jgi:TRAP transporter 4TM/12TM fusion protein